MVKLRDSFIGLSTQVFRTFFISSRKYLKYTNFEEWILSPLHEHVYHFTHHWLKSRFSEFHSRWLSKVTWHIAQLEKKGEGRTLEEFNRANFNGFDRHFVHMLPLRNSTSITHSKSARTQLGQRLHSYNMSLISWVGLSKKLVKLCSVDRLIDQWTMHKTMIWTPISYGKTQGKIYRIGSLECLLGFASEHVPQCKLHCLLLISKFQNVGFIYEFLV